MAAAGEEEVCRSNLVSLSVTYLLHLRISFLQARYLKDSVFVDYFNAFLLLPVSYHHYILYLN